MHPDNSEFISGRQARKLLGTTGYTVLRLAALGRIRCRETLAGDVQFNRADVLQLLSEHQSRD